MSPPKASRLPSPPLYYEGMIFVGPVGSEYGVRGFMEAFNAKTGALRLEALQHPGSRRIRA